MNTIFLKNEELKLKPYHKTIQNTLFLIFYLQPFWIK